MINELSKAGRSGLSATTESCASSSWAESARGASRNAMIRLAIFIIFGLLVILGATVYPAFYDGDFCGTQRKAHIKGVVVARQALEENTPFGVAGRNICRYQGIVGIPHPQVGRLDGPVMAGRAFLPASGEEGFDVFRERNFLVWGDLGDFGFRHYFVVVAGRCPQAKPYGQHYFYQSTHSLWFK